MYLTIDGERAAFTLIQHGYFEYSVGNRRKDQAMVERVETVTVGEGENTGMWVGGVFSNSMQSPAATGGGTYLLLSSYHDADR